jgi:hypothetical protein
MMKGIIFMRGALTEFPELEGRVPAMGSRSIAAG